MKERGHYSSIEFDGEISSLTLAPILRWSDLTEDSVRNRGWHRSGH